jgi:hypothetical protein
MVALIVANLQWLIDMLNSFIVLIGYKYYTEVIRPSCRFFL